MDFDQCFDILKNDFCSLDFSDVGTDFSVIIYITGNHGGYIYIASVDDEMIIEPVKHESANLFISIPKETFEEIYQQQLDPFKAFTTGKIKAKGNVALAFSLFNKLKT
ncbi:MAG: SCP2 sterol-binding domain-containing protein [Clostridia bacterium]|nr:SCP2 sterol-binding domain-containing protein [Clostridia bacterium]